MGKCSVCTAEIEADAPSGLCAACQSEQSSRSTAAALQDDGFGLAVEAETAAVPIVPAADLAALFPQFDQLELIGRGGMGVVYKARHTRLDRLVALKVISPHFAGDPAFIERFSREARSLAKLNHPNIACSALNIQHYIRPPPRPSPGVPGEGVKTEPHAYV